MPRRTRPICPGASWAWTWCWSAPASTAPRTRPRPTSMPAPRRSSFPLPAGNDLPTIVYSVNEKTLKPEDTIISAASCTTNCLAPMAKALNELCPHRQSGYHDHHPCLHRRPDDPGRPAPQGRPASRPRRAPCNIVPNSTGAAKAIGLVIPELNGKLIGAAQRVPVCTGSTTDPDRRRQGQGTSPRMASTPP